ncbi:MAG TPA: AMP-binding protein [Pseudonocardia sp.]|nr:AMP-binding protein [Pseudonocardia sp.]
MTILDGNANTRRLGCRPPEPGLLDHYRRAGLVTEMAVNQMLPVRAARRSSHAALTQGDTCLTYGQLRARVDRAAGHLTGAGIGPGDVVCWQTPNWWESYVLALAIWQVGAISNPVVPFYRENELRHITAELRPDAVICAGPVRNHNAAELMEQVLAEAGVDPRVRIVVRGSLPGWTPAQEVFEHPPSPELALIDADAPCLVLYTSGTTSAPKGVMHSSRTLLAETEQIRHEWCLGWEDTAYMPAPLQHITGVLMGMTVPLLGASHSVLSDGWDAERAAEEIDRHEVTFSAGATIFLQELTAATVTRPPRSTQWRIYGCGGAPVPRAVMERAEDAGIPAIRIYGMTELPTVSLGDRAVPFDRRASTDGRIAVGVEVRAVDETDVPLPLGEPGELLVRGPERFLGYVDAKADVAITEDGWFRTGDIGLCDGNGDITITGRLKDIINRGGEKFSTREIEDLLARHPAVRQAAVVPAPDARFGEVPAAFVVTDAGLAPDGVDPADLVAHLVAAGLPKQKLPVGWHAVEELPMTASGKVRKVELVKRLSTEA